MIEKGEGGRQGMDSEFGVGRRKLLHLFIILKIFIYLAAPDFNCGHVRSSSLTRDRTRVHCVGSSGASATGPPGKAH